jgi:hypothetical protein
MRIFPRGHSISPVVSIWLKPSTNHDKQRSLRNVSYVLCNTLNAISNPASTQNEDKEIE